MQYKVQSGDTLSKIADALLGDSTLWPAIAKANNMRAPYAIEVDQILTVPEASMVTDLGPGIQVKIPMPPPAAPSTGGPFGLPPKVFGIPTPYLLVGVAILMLAPLFFGEK